MSEKNNSANSQGGKRKKDQKSKKSPPLNDNYYSVLDLNGKECVNTGERKKAKTKKYSKG